jgi:hypothetical protein
MYSHLESVLQSLGLEVYLAGFVDHCVDDSLLGELSDADLRELGVDKLGHRKKLLAAFSGMAHAGSASVVAAAPAEILAPTRPTTVVPLQPARPPAAIHLPPSRLTGLVPAAPPAGVEKKQANEFVNSLGMPFVRVRDVSVHFCIWPVRVCDYHVYCQETETPYPTCDYEQGSTHPVVNVTWLEANAFCVWLLKRERELGLLDDQFAYRLPTDREWSAAVGLSYEVKTTPKERNLVAGGYPWGMAYPPPVGAGNYHQILGIDDFKETSPVGSFAPNKYGIYDMGGNVWEWCEDRYEPTSPLRVLRGASCFNEDSDYLRSSYRDANATDRRRNNNGFRIVLAAVKATVDPWK